MINPTYQDGQTIYEDLSNQLDTAATLFASPAATAAAGTDVMFGAGPTVGKANVLWIEFCNTLRLRLLMRQTQMNGRGAYITGEIAKITANGGGFLTTDAQINPGYANNDQQKQPLGDISER